MRLKTLLATAALLTGVALVNPEARADVYVGVGVGGGYYGPPAPAYYAPPAYGYGYGYSAVTIYQPVNVRPYYYSAPQHPYLLPYASPYPVGYYNYGWNGPEYNYYIGGGRTLEIEYNYRPWGYEVEYDVD